MLVTAYDPSLVVVGGGVSQAGEILLSAMRESLFRHSRSLAVRDVSLVRTELGRTAGLVGAAFAVAEDLFTRERVRTWIADGRPPRAGEGNATEAAPPVAALNVNGLGGGMRSRAGGSRAAGASVEGS